MLRMYEVIWKILIFRKNGRCWNSKFFMRPNFHSHFRLKKNRPKKKSFVHPEDNYIYNKWKNLLIDRLSRSQVTVITDFENVVSRKTRLKFWVRFACRYRRLHSKPFISINNNPIYLEFLENTFEIFYF